MLNLPDARSASAWSAFRFPWRKRPQPIPRRRLPSRETLPFPRSDPIGHQFGEPARFISGSLRHYAWSIAFLAHWSPHVDAQAECSEFLDRTLQGRRVLDSESFCPNLIFRRALIQLRLRLRISAAQESGCCPGDGSFKVRTALTP